MQNRRNNRTPFSVNGTFLIDSQNQPIAMFVTTDLAAFVCRACNLHDSLMSAYDLCRGHVNNMTLQPGNVTLKNLHDLFQRIADDISKSGR